MSSSRSMSGAFANWVEPGDKNSVDHDFRVYMHSVAEARYLVRKVIRIVHEQAKLAGLDPLEHEALVQIFGGGATEALSVNQVAGRLDVAAALTSRVIKELDAKQLVHRKQAAEDKRVTRVGTTEAGVAILKEIDRQVHIHIDYFQKQLEEDDRLSLMAIFAFWVGLDGDSQIGGAIRTAVSERTRTERGRARRRPTSATLS